MVIDISTFFDLPREVDKIINEAGRGYTSRHRGVDAPLLNIAEDDNGFYVDVLVPGVDPADIDLQLTEKSLVISGERKAEAGRYFRKERGAGSFQRVVNIAAPVDRDSVKARFADGILYIELPKAESVKPRKVAIES